MTMDSNSVVSIDVAGRFLADYSAMLYSSGATCIRLEKNVGRMAEAWGVKASLTILPSRIQVSLSGAGCVWHSYSAESGKTRTSFEIITRLSRLSWRVADSRLSPSDARRIMNVIGASHGSGKWWTLFAVACANSAFCRLFGGDSQAMSVVFGATLAGYYLKQFMLSSKVDVRIAFLVCAFVSSVLAAAGYLFSLGKTPDVAVATSVLYLVPGIPFLNAFSDMTDRHYISCLSRLTDAVILTCCLSAGLYLGMKLMNVGMF